MNTPLLDGYQWRRCRWCGRWFAACLIGASERMCALFCAQRWFYSGRMGQGARRAMMLA